MTGSDPMRISAGNVCRLTWALHFTACEVAYDDLEPDLPWFKSWFILYGLRRSLRAYWSVSSSAASAKKH